MTSDELQKIDAEIQRLESQKRNAEREAKVGLHVKMAQTLSDSYDRSLKELYEKREKLLEGSK